MWALYVEKKRNIMGTAKEQCETLMNEAIDFAEVLLNKNGEFFPFGKAMDADGNIVSVAAYDGDEHSPSQEVIDMLKAGFRSCGQKGEYIACALAYDVRVRSQESGDPVDAVAIDLDNVNDYSVTVFFPYSMQNGEAVFGSISAQQGDNDIFR
jgi:hypothetical protein